MRIAAGRALLAQREALVHAEAVLLVHDHEREPREADLLLEERMRADHDAAAAVGDRRSARRAAARAVSRPVSSSGSMSSGASQRAKFWRCCSASSSVGAISAAWWPASTASSAAMRRDDRLAGADVTLHEPEHRMRDREIGRGLAWRRGVALS